MRSFRASKVCVAISVKGHAHSVHLTEAPLTFAVQPSVLLLVLLLQPRLALAEGATKLAVFDRKRAHAAVQDIQRLRRWSSLSGGGHGTYDDGMLQGMLLTLLGLVRMTPKPTGNSRVT
jgi:hypothetical protein